MAGYTLYYISEDMESGDHPGDDPRPAGTWSVYREDYETINSPEPIEGSTVLVSGNHIKMEADRIANVCQQMSYSENRRASHGA